MELSHIHTLNLSHNNITILDNSIYNTILPNLTTLDISFNLIDTIINEFPKKLKILKLQRNNINKISYNILLQCTQLEYLDISHNNIRSMNHISLPVNKLEYLDISYNQLINGDMNLRMISLCNKLITIIINPNPFIKTNVNYKVRIMSLLPNVSVIDSHIVHKKKSKTTNDIKHLSTIIIGKDNIYKSFSIEQSNKLKLKKKLKKDTDKKMNRDKQSEMDAKRVMEYQQKIFNKQQQQLEMCAYFENQSKSTNKSLTPGELEKLTLRLTKPLKRSQTLDHSYLNSDSIYDNNPTSSYVRNSRSKSISPPRNFIRRGYDGPISQDDTNSSFISKSTYVNEIYRNNNNNHRMNSYNDISNVDDVMMQSDIQYGNITHLQHDDINSLYSNNNTFVNVTSSIDPRETYVEPINIYDRPSVDFMLHMPISHQKEYDSKSVMSTNDVSSRMDGIKSRLLLNSVNIQNSNNNINSKNNHNVSLTVSPSHFFDELSDDDEKSSTTITTPQIALTTSDKINVDLKPSAEAVVDVDKLLSFPTINISPVKMDQDINGEGSSHSDELFEEENKIGIFTEIEEEVKVNHEVNTSNEVKKDMDTKEVLMDENGLHDDVEDSVAKRMELFRARLNSKSNNQSVKLAQSVLNYSNASLSEGSVDMSKYNESDDGDSSSAENSPVKNRSITTITISEGISEKEALKDRLRAKMAK
jgi:hypothetical protein